MLKGLSEQHRAQDAPFKGSAQHRPGSQEHLREDAVCCQLEFLDADWKCRWVFAIQRLPADGEGHVTLNFIKEFSFVSVQWQQETQKIVKALKQTL